MSDTGYMSFSADIVPQKTGILVAKPKPKDWMAGGETGVAFEEVVPDGDWTRWLPSTERQSNARFDTYACVSYSLLNSFETQMNRLMRENVLDIHEQQAIRRLGFLDDSGNFNCSDRFLAKMSNTGSTGNYLNIVADTLRKSGAVPEADWPFPGDGDRNQYYSDIPFPIQDKALEILKIVDIAWEWVAADLSSIRQHLRQAPLQIATPVCPGWSTVSPVASCSLGVGHATLLYALDNQSENRLDFDHYPPFYKMLAPDYPILFVLKLVVSRKAGTTPPAPPPDSFSHIFVRDLAFGETSDEVKALQTALKADGSFPLKVQATGYYGSITAAAVLAFQKKYTVVSWVEMLRYKGNRVEQKTRDALNSLYGKK